MEDEEMEFTVLNKREVMIFQIPPASSSKGHKADDWKQCIWRGRMRVVGKGKELAIKMMDGGSGQLFAQCQIPGGDHEKYVERVTDSSRYFVLKITNGARHAFIGLGFEDRNDAFDFNCALSDFKTTWVDREKVPEIAPEYTGPAKDLSMKEGQKIKLNLKGKFNKEEDEDEDGNVKPKPKPKTHPLIGSSSGGGTLGFGLIAPPPGSGPSRQVAAAAPVGGGYSAAAAPAVAAAPAAAADFDDFGFDDFKGAPAPAAAPVQSTAAFADFCTPAPAAAFPAAAPAPVAASAGGSNSGFGDFGFDTFQAAPAPSPAAAPAGRQPAMDLSAQLGSLSLGGPSSTPAMQQAMPMGGANQMSSGGAMPMGGMQFPAAQATPQTSMFSAPAASPQPKQQVQASSGGFDPFAGISSLGGGGNILGTSSGPPSAPKPTVAAPKKLAGGRDPFDDFDIFK